MPDATPLPRLEAHSALHERIRRLDISEDYRERLLAIVDREFDYAEPVAANRGAKSGSYFRLHGTLTAMRRVMHTPEFASELRLAVPLERWMTREWRRDDDERSYVPVGVPVPPTSTPQPLPLAYVPVEATRKDLREQIHAETKLKRSGNYSRDTLIRDGIQAGVRFAGEGFMAAQAPFAITPAPQLEPGEYEVWRAHVPVERIGETHVVTEAADPPTVIQKATPPADVVTEGLADADVTIAGDVTTGGDVDEGDDLAAGFLDDPAEEG